MNLEKIIAIRNAKTIYCDENNCVKVFNKEYSKADILNEALNQARVEELPINVPKIKELNNIANNFVRVIYIISNPYRILSWSS